MNIEDINYVPTQDEMCSYVGNPLLEELCSYMEETYKALCKIEFSKCSWEYGWNMKFKKVGKGLCTVYPKEGYFRMLVVVGAKEKEAVEELLPELSPILQEIYHETEEGNGQRWLMVDLEDKDEVYEDVLKLIDIRRYS